MSQQTVAKDFGADHPNHASADKGVWNKASSYGNGNGGNNFAAEMREFNVFFITPMGQDVFTLDNSDGKGCYQNQRHGNNA